MWVSKLIGPNFPLFLNHALRLAVRERADAGMAEDQESRFSTPDS
jgi:hypothetical protein